MHFSHVRTPKHECIRCFDIIVTPHRFVSTEGTHRTEHRSSHTMSGIAFDAVGTKTGFHQLVGGVSLPNRPLTRTEHADSCRTELTQRSFELCLHHVERFGPADWGKLTVLIVSAAAFSQQRGG